MGLLQRVKLKFQSMMTGRNGVDRLSQTMLWFGIGLLVLAMVLSSNVLNLFAMAVYILAILRVFSRNVEKRRAENMQFVTKTTAIQKAIIHRRNRFKHRKEYRYFKCPNCKSWLRLPRGAGQVKVTCGNCKHQFSYISK